MSPSKKTSRFDSLLSATHKTPSEAVTPPATSTSNEPVKSSKSRSSEYIRTTLYLPKTLHRQLKTAALETEQDMSEIVAQLIADWLANQDSSQ